MRQKKVSLHGNDYCTEFYEDRRDELPFQIPHQLEYDPDFHVCAGLDSTFGGSCFVRTATHLWCFERSGSGHGNCLFQGDSGGALACQDEHGNWLAHGVVSFGTDGNRCVDRIGIYARTETYLSFIHHVIDEYSP